MFAKITDLYEYPITASPQNWGPNFIGFNTLLFCALHPDLMFQRNGEKELEGMVNVIHEPFDFIIAMRVASAIFSSLSLFIIFFIAKDMFGHVSALFAMSICAISPLLITEAKAAKEDSLLLFVFLLSFYCYQRFLVKESNLFLRLSCFFAGFAFGVKIIGILMAPFYFVYFIKELYNNYLARGFRHAASATLTRAETFLLYFSAGYLCLNFYFLLSPITVIRTFLTMKSTFGPQEISTGNTFFFLFEVLPYGVGWIVVIAALIGTIYFLFRRKWVVLSLAAISLILIALLHKSPVVYDRYALLLIPIFAILGTGFVCEISSNIMPFFRILLQSILLGAIFWQIVPTTFATNNLLGKTSTRKLAGDYLREEMKDGESALILRYPFWLGQGPMYGLNPMKRDWFDNPEWMEKAREHVAFDNVEFLSIDNLRDRKPDWIVVEYHSNGQISILPDKMNDAENLLLNNYEKRYALSPAQDFEKVKFNSWALPLSGFQYAQTYGPRIKIFKNKAPLSNSGGDSQNLSDDGF
jgi:hypothetical protein